MSLNNYNNFGLARVQRGAADVNYVTWTDVSRAVNALGCRARLILSDHSGECVLYSPLLAVMVSCSF